MRADDDQPGSSWGIYCNHAGCPETLGLSRTTATPPTHEQDYQELAPACAEAALSLGWRARVRAGDVAVRLRRAHIRSPCRSATAAARQQSPTKTARRQTSTSSLRCASGGEAQSLRGGLGAFLAREGDAHRSAFCSSKRSSLHITGAGSRLGPFHILKDSVAYH